MQKEEKFKIYLILGNSIMSVYGSLDSKTALADSIKGSHCGKRQSMFLTAGRRNIKMSIKRCLI